MRLVPRSAQRRFPHFRSAPSVRVGGALLRARGEAGGNGHKRLAFRVRRFRDPLKVWTKATHALLVSMQLDYLDAHCNACGFTMKGLPEEMPRACGMCGLPLETRTN